MAKEDTLTLPILDQTGGMGEEERGREKKEEGGRRRREREKLHILSSFSGDRTVDSHRSKKESSSSRQELRVETGIMEF